MPNIVLGVRRLQKSLLFVVSSTLIRYRRNLDFLFDHVLSSVYFCNESHHSIEVKSTNTGIRLIFICFVLLTSLAFPALILSYKLLLKASSEVEQQSPTFLALETGAPMRI